MTNQEQAQEHLDKIENANAALHRFLDTHENATPSDNEYIKLWGETWDAEIEARRFLQKLDTNTTTTCIWMLKCLASNPE